ncbi:MAG: ATP-binding cassette domain-containing protein, partial [Gammaproteobacteria bacterium]
MSRALSVRKLRVWLRTPRGELPVVRGLDLDLEAGERIGMAGESGSGKTVTALALMGLLGTRGRVTADRLRLGDTDLLSLPEPAWRRLRGPGLAMVFQDPATALDPVFRVGDQLAAAIRR